MEKRLLQEDEATTPAAHDVVTLLKYSSLVAFLVGSCSSQVCLKRTTLAANFPAALTQLSGMVGVILYSLIVLIGLLSQRIKLVGVMVPPQKPLIVAALFVLHHTLLNVGAGDKSVPGLYIAVLSKSVIPISMALNMMLGVRYSLKHWFSFAVVIVGVYLTLHGGALALEAHTVWCMTLIVLSIVPLALAFAYIEHTLKQEHPDLWGLALWLWISLFMSLLALTAAPLSAWLQGQPVGHALPFKKMQQGMQCYIRGVQAEDMILADCESASRAYWQGAVFEVAMNLGMAVSTRYAGATLMWFVKALTTPLAGICFALPLFMGELARPFTPNQALGLLVVTSGVLLFNSEQPARSKAAEARVVAVSDGASTDP